MSDKVVYALLGFDQDTNDKLDKISLKLKESGFIGRQTKDLPHHITLSGVKIEDQDRFMDSIKKISENTEAFDIYFSHIGLFSKGNVLFIGNDLSKELIDLRNQIGKTDSFCPHATILIDDYKVIEQALPHVVETFNQFNGTVTSIYLYEFFPAKLIQQYYLQKKR